MPHWAREVTHALGTDERHAEPGLSAALALSLAAAVQAPFGAFHAAMRVLDTASVHLVTYAFLLAMAAFAGIVSFRPARSYGYFHRPSCAVTWALVSALAVGAVPALQHAGMANEVVLALTASLFGVGLTYVLFYLAHLFTRGYIPDVVRSAVAGAAVAVVFVAAVSNRLPATAAYVTSAGLLALDAAVLPAVLRHSPAVGDFAPFKSFSDRRGDAGLFLAKVALPMACTGVVLYLFFAQSEHAAQNLPAPGLANDLNLVLLAVVAYVIVSFAIYGVRSFGWPFAQLFSFLIPLVCLLGTVCVSTNVGGPASYDGGTMVMLGLILGLSWSFMAGASLEYLLRSASVFGMGLASLAVGAFLGDLFVHAGLLGTAPGNIVLSLVCLAMAVGYLPPRPAPNLSRSTYTTPLRSVPTPEELELTDETGTAGAAEEGAPVPAVAAASNQCPHPAPKGRFMRRCDAAAEAFLLSARETEVLYLLAKGHSMSHIMEELVISEGTAKTHISHVYKKLGIHSRHELLDLVESMDVEDIDLS